MRQVMVATLSLILLLAFPMNTVAQETSQDFKINGFVNLQEKGEGLDIGWTRLFPSFRYHKFELSFEFEAQDIDNDVLVEWFNQGRFIYRPTESTSIAVGRNFRAFGYSAFAPVLLMTVKYPDGYPYSGYYAYGVRVDHTHGNWDFKVDVTADSKPGFRKFSIDQPEFSFRAGKKSRAGFTNLSYGISGQFSNMFAREGLDVQVKVSQFSLAGGVFNSDDNKKTISGLAIAEWDAGVIKPFVQYTSGDKGMDWTAGSALIIHKEHQEWKFIVDYNGKNLFSRLQIWFF